MLHVVVMHSVVRLVCLVIKLILKYTRMCWIYNLYFEIFQLLIAKGASLTTENANGYVGILFLYFTEKLCI